MSVISACDKKEDEEPEQPQEYIATDASFEGFQSWELAAQEQGPDPALGMAKLVRSSSEKAQLQSDGWVYL